jgi:hypothetical protein
MLRIEVQDETGKFEDRGEGIVGRMDVGCC